MPKKFAGENTKAVIARERKKAQKEEANYLKEKELEDAKWKDDNKQVIKKQQRKEAEERKKLEQLQRKAENKAMLEKEMSSMTKSSKTTTKTTRAQIETMKESSAKKKDVETRLETHLTAPLIENLNRLGIDENQASNIDEAIHILSNSVENVDKHPEKRLKAAYTSFEDKRLKMLKAEHPSLKLSQLKQMIFKEWQKSSENPLNKT